MSNKEIEIRVCNKCGRELPIEKYELMKPRSGKPYHLKTCKDCRYKYMRSLIEKKRDVKLSDDIMILVHRIYKRINPQRILNLSQTDISPVGEDEIFVKLMDYKDVWLSNYGRMIKYSSGKYSLLPGYRDSSGMLRYVAQKNILNNGKWVWKRMTIYAAHEVVREFIVSPDTVNNIFVWHKGNNKKDNYYKNLYPLNQEQYYALRRYYNKNNDDSEKIIVKIMNDIRYKPDDWSAKSMAPSICGIGYHGRENVDRTSRAYIRWHDMMHRCYNRKFHKRQPQYSACEVCEEWRNFCNFEKWYNEHYYEIEDESMDLDKDILFKGNKEYSPAACCIVPHGINTLFLTCKKKRGDLPMGVCFNNRDSRYCVSTSHRIPVKNGRFTTAEEAFARYKEYKEDFIKDIAGQYKGKIPDKMYQAMVNWQIETTD